MAPKIKVGFLGAGKMGGILLEGIVKSGIVPAKDVCFYEAAPARAKQMENATKAVKRASASDVVLNSDLVFICVKPDQFAGVAAEIKNVWADRKPCLASIMAGVKSATVKELVSEKAAVVRVMPNVACTVKKGVAGVASDSGAPKSMSNIVFKLFEELGGAVWVLEKSMDAVTALSGSGPAYVFMFIEALADAGVKVGLDRATSESLAMRTVAGAAEMALKGEYDTLQLRAQVSSPGGTTVAGTSVLENRAFRSAVIDAVQAAWKRSLELGGN